MRATNRIFVWLFAALVAAPSAGARVSPKPLQGRVVDRIVAKIEGDIILLSQVHELGAFQQLIQGHQETDDRLLGELIEQWVVQTEATTTHFPQPAKSEVDREMDRIAAQFATPEAFAAKLAALNLTTAEVREMLTQQIYLERYLDYKFRPTVQIDAPSVETYYQKEFRPVLEAKNQLVPPLPEVEGEIREVLTQRAISDRVAQWLDETKSHLTIELASPSGKP
jgi:hypothetical protein